MKRSEELLLWRLCSICAGAQEIEIASEVVGVLLNEVWVRLDVLTLEYCGII